MVDYPCFEGQAGIPACGAAPAAPRSGRLLNLKPEHSPGNGVTSGQPHMIHFVGIGAQKAGTTWFYEQLRKHPDIRFPAGKEVHFWDKDAALARGEAWWLALFPQAPARVRQGEITPAYAILDQERIRRIHALVPGLRIFYCIRNPLERAWSHALMVLKNRGKSLDDAEDDWLDGLLHWDQSVRRGTYTACLRNWLAVFPPEQLATVFFDDIVADPRSVLRGICAHLGLDEAPFVKASESELRTRVFEGMKARPRPAHVAALRALYEPEVAALSEQFGRNLEHWLTWDGRGD